MADREIILALLGIIGTLVALLGFIIKNELALVRKSNHRLANAIHEALLIFSIVDDRYKEKIRQDMGREKENGN